jgi:hypothetical protein
MRDICYELVDCEGLATILAEDAWTEEVKVKALSDHDLYDGKGPDRKVKPEWEESFNLLRDRFAKLIDQFKSNPTCNLQGKKSR